MEKPTHGEKRGVKKGGETGMLLRRGAFSADTESGEEKKEGGGGGVKKSC